MKLCDNKECMSHVDIIKKNNRWHFAGGFGSELAKEHFLGAVLEVYQEGELVGKKNYCHKCATVVKDLFQDSAMEVVEHDRST